MSFYTLEQTQVETTLELLRPQKELPRRQKNGSVATAATTSRKRDRSHSNYDNDDGGGEEKINNNDLVGCSHPTPMTQRERIVKVLQHITMSTNFFLVMEDNDDDVSNNATNSSSSSSSSSSHGNVLAGLSRTLWRALARFVIEEVDRSQNDDDDDDDNEEEEEEYSDNEDCQIAATDVLFRLTKHQVHNILFHNRRVMDENYRGNYVVNNNNNNDRRRLSEEEFSILVITILRLLGHPDEYWTSESQDWVANLLRDPLHGVKLRMVLRATVLCTSYVPDALPRVEQIRIVSSLQEILLSTMMKKKTTTAAVAASTTATSNTYSPSSVTGSFDVRVEEEDLLEDPWQSFWQIHH